MLNKKIIGALLVSMAATAVFAADAPAAPKADAKPAPLCQNNECKGKADCKGFGNESCKGQNECKAQGHIDAKDKAACVKKHGTWTAKK